jgi:hypothetical protein
MLFLRNGRTSFQEIPTDATSWWGALLISTNPNISNSWLDPNIPPPLPTWQILNGKAAKTVNGRIKSGYFQKVATLQKFGNKE